MSHSTVKCIQFNGKLTKWNNRGLSSRRPFRPRRGNTLQRDRNAPIMSAITPCGVVIECSEESPIEIERVNKGMCAPLQIRLQKPIFPERTPRFQPPLLICICPETGRREGSDDVHCCLHLRTGRFGYHNHHGQRDRDDAERDNGVIKSARRERWTKAALQMTMWGGEDRVSIFTIP
ncbi:hypothetical protein CEXT_529851 [Caerostris extrusa]|uniref:Uncharacterized protein n=1 Tax=Caerostris extrusa TaxID=172846 RepID=A0AAV4YE01_CAEEX|nr:hypothetical protein CEXT_529851 [Caerostris extrusa]